jgi:hypothetical protein
LEAGEELIWRVDELEAAVAQLVGEKEVLGDTAKAGEELEAAAAQLLEEEDEKRRAAAGARRRSGLCGNGGQQGHAHDSAPVAGEGRNADGGSSVYAEGHADHSPTSMPITTLVSSRTTSTRT